MAAVIGHLVKRVRFFDGKPEASVVPPGTWSTVQSMPLFGLHSKNLAPLQLRRARQMKIFAAKQRDAAELQLLRQKVQELEKRSQYITVEVEKTVVVSKIVQVVDQMDEHPKVKKSKLSEEDEVMNEMMKDAMKAMQKKMADELAECLALKEAGFLQTIKAVQEKMAELHADEVIVRTTNFMQTIKEMEAKADADKTKMLSLQINVKELEKCDSDSKSKIAVGKIFSG